MELALESLPVIVLGLTYVGPDATAALPWMVSPLLPLLLVDADEASTACAPSPPGPPCGWSSPCTALAF